MKNFLKQFKISTIIYTVLTISILITILFNINLTLVLFGIFVGLFLSETIDDIKKWYMKKNNIINEDDKL